MAAITLPLLVLESTGSLVQMGLVTASLALGNVLAGVVSGALADRLDRRFLLLCYDSVSALFYATIPLVWWLWGPHVLLLYLLAPPLGFLSMASSVAATASLPRLVAQGQLLQAISRFQTIYALAYLIGPLLAGSLMSLFNAPTIMLFNALSYLVSVLSLLLIQLRPATTAKTSTPAPLDRSILSGLRFWFKDLRLRSTVLLRLLSLSLIAGGLDLVVFRLEHELHFGAEVVGLVWGLGSLGAIAAGILTPLLRRRFGFGTCFLGGQALMGLSVAIIGLNASVPIFLALGITLTFGDILAQITSASLTQEMTPDALQGRVVASIQTLLWAGSALGAASSTFLAGWIGSTQPVFVGMGLLILLFSILAMLTPARHRVPEYLDDPIQPK